MFWNAKKKYLILGGTGSLGTALIDNLSCTEPDTQIINISRDEFKQKRLSLSHPKVKNFLGDIKDRDSLNNHYKGIHTVFHFAAQKHVDIGEENPDECIKSNILGVINSAQKAMDAKVKYFVFTSSDKAVLPINTYGLCKALAEKYLLALNQSQNVTKFIVFRWGNVIGSRGSVIHYFLDTLNKEKKVYLTDDRMTRFWIKIKDVVNFILSHYETAPLDRVCWPKMKASTITELADSCADVLNITKYDIEILGIRPGEKLHETLHSSHDFCVRSDTCERFTKDELKQLVRSIYVK